MDFKEIQDIIEREGGKIIIVENDKPRMVVMAFAEWKKNQRSERPGELAQTPPKAENIEAGGGLTIDDLPL